jgi:ribonucleoside-triphosphate reductase
MFQRDLANDTANSISKIIASGVFERISYLKKNIIPSQYFSLYENRKIHIHDIEFYDITYNCLGLSVQRLIGEKWVDFRDVCRRLTHGITELSNYQSGGIGFIEFDSDMSEYISTENDNELKRSFKELLQDLNTNLRKGCEKAYVTFNFGLDTSEKARRITKVLLDAFSEGENGQPYIFPNLVFKLRKGINILPDDPNFDLFYLSAETTAQSMIPTYFNVDASYNKSFISKRIGIMGCRTRIAANKFGEDGSLFRGNIAAVTINLVQLALESNQNMKRFYSLLDSAMNSACNMLLHRLEILTEYGCFDFVKNKNLMAGSNVDVQHMLRNGTLAIGFIGLWETINILYNISPIEPDMLYIQKKELEIIQYMRKKTDSFTESENYNFSLLATSAEGVSGRFPAHDINVYGVIKGITDKEYYTNSFHVPVNVEISYFDKIKLESPFHKFCNGGCITYVEMTESPIQNIEAIIELVLYAYNSDINYFGINFPLDVCHCGARGVFHNVCPICGGQDIKRLRRVSGYLSDVASFTSGKKAELADRKPNRFNSITKNIWNYQ